MAKLEKRKRMNGCFPLPYRRSRLSSLMILALAVALHSVFSLREPFDEKGAASSTFNGKQPRGEAVTDGKKVESRNASNVLHALLTEKRLVKRTSSRSRDRFSARRYPRSESSDCGVPDFAPKPNSRIVGGVEARPHSWPWQASVMILSQNAWQHCCGGTVLSPTWIITAAHCLHGFGSASNFRVRLGAHDRVHQGSTEQAFEVKEMVIHADYNSATHDNDIALLHLPTKAEFNRFVKPLCMPEADVGDNFLCLASGWGSTIGTATGNESALQQVYLPVVNQSLCNQPNWYNGRVTDNMFCAGYPNGMKDACQGDSG